jgi:hypothetical protein
MNANDLILRHGKEWKGITLFQIIGRCKGEGLKILERPDIIRPDTCLVKPGPIEQRTLIRMIHRPFEAPKLQGL